MRITRRLVLLSLASTSLAHAKPDLEDAIRALIGNAAITDGGVELHLPARVENGAQVPLTIRADSPMTEADHITAIHLFATANPTPGIASFHLTPHLARAEIQTRIRLAQGQQVIALAVHSDGRIRRATAEAQVTQGGCLS